MKNSVQNPPKQAEISGAPVHGQAKLFSRHALSLQQLLQEAFEQPEKFRSNKDLASAMCISLSHLARLCKKTTGQSPQSVLAAAKRKRAVSLLENSNLPIKEIAGACDFSDANHFSAWFRRKFACSPTQFRMKKHELKEESTN